MIVGDAGLTVGARCHVRDSVDPKRSVAAGRRDVVDARQLYPKGAREQTMSQRPTLTATGLCGACRFASVVPSARGPQYLRCGRSDLNAAYARYPQLPMQQCVGFEPRRERDDE